MYLQKKIVYRYSHWVHSCWPLVSISTFTWSYHKVPTGNKGSKILTGLSQLDVGDEVLERNISDEYKEPITLSMQDNGLSKLEMIDPDETQPSKVIHPKLGLGTSPRGVLVEDWHTPLVIGMQDKKTHIEYTFDKGKFLIKIDMKPKEGHSRQMKA